MTTQLLDTPPLYCRGNGHRVRHILKTRDDETDMLVPALYLTVTTFIAETAAGAAIDPEVSVTLTQHDVSKVYEGTIPGTALEAHVLPLGEGTTVYEVTVVPGSAYRAERPYTVSGSRLPGGA